MDHVLNISPTQQWNEECLMAYCAAAMLATQLNDKVTSGELDTNCVIRLDKYICNPIQPDRSVDTTLSW